MPTNEEYVEEIRQRLAILEAAGADARLLHGWADEGAPETRGLHYSERTDVKGAQVQSLDPEYCTFVTWVEEKLGGRVFQATLEHSIMGDLLDLFVVSDDSSLWGDERAALQAGTARAWVVSFDQPPASAWFDVDFEVIEGALVRVG